MSRTKREIELEKAINYRRELSVKIFSEVCGWFKDKFGEDNRIELENPFHLGDSDFYVSYVEYVKGNGLILCEENNPNPHYPGVEDVEDLAFLFEELLDD